ncbi:hypothetical protein GmHk_10G028066 [Glycine max]|nr:hypothetical protein GmHk_10G028066 [Glycine max]
MINHGTHSMSALEWAMTMVAKSSTTKFELNNTWTKRKNGQVHRRLTQRITYTIAIKRENIEEIDKIEQEVVFPQDGGIEILSILVLEDSMLESRERCMCLL